MIVSFCPRAIEGPSFCGRSEPSRFSIVVPRDDVVPRFAWRRGLHLAAVFAVSGRCNVKEPTPFLRNVLRFFSLHIRKIKLNLKERSRCPGATIWIQRISPPSRRLPVWRAPHWKHSFRDRVFLESFAHASALAPRSVLIGGPTHMSEAMPQLSQARERLPETHQGDPEKRGRNDG